jgi:D-beta-D-heptose 7-phosphate kinase/D-beta-D-heptose 1-phosphate adenosyltransferase
MKNILVIGERCEDIFHYGNVERLSPEAPIPVLTNIESVSNEGMAKNVYNNLVRMNEIYKKRFDIDIITSTYCPKKERYVDRKSNHYFIRVDEPNYYESLEFTTKNITRIKRADYIVISDYNKGFLLPSQIKEICKYKKKKCVIFIDTKKILDEDNYSSVDFIKMNAHEWENNCNASQNLVKLYYPKIIVTHGSMGAIHKSMHFKTNSVVSMDVSGAGDTFLGGLVFEYAQSQKIDKSIKFANEMANIVVSKKGVSIV